MYAVLGDPKNIFGFQHVALVITTSLLNRLGPAFQQAYAAVTKLLTIDAMRSLNAAVAIDGKVPASVAHAFLVANHLLTS
jgi:glycine betaine/choline ABC-type transport system substrate-binding protein